MYQDVYGRFLAPDGAPLSGSVIFTPTFLFARDSQAVTLPAPVAAKLDAEGRVSASLLVPAADAEPDAWVWEACPQLRGPQGAVRMRDFAFELTESAPVNLAEVLPVPDPVTGEYVTQGKPGADGVGLAAITTEGGELVFTLTDGSESRIPVPQGVPGDDGKDGVGLATITLEGGELVFTLTDGAEQRLPAPVGEKGDPGEDGKPGQPGKDGTSPPAPTLRVEQVQTLPPGSTATAHIGGEAPDYTLTLGVPQGAPGAKGDKGDSIIGPAGPKGEPGNPSALVLVGVGRPDTPSTLSPENQAAVSSALVGATFTSTDGAGTGAWAWVKTPTGWQVTYGDTGFSVFHAQGTTGADIGPLSKGWVTRVGKEVTAVVMLDKDSGSLWSRLTPVPSGFRPYQTPLRMETGTGAGVSMENIALASVDYVIWNGNGDRAQLPDGHSIHVMRSGQIRGKALPRSGWASLSWVTSDPWPATLPGALA